jgi:uncharacterized protein (TIGR03067 family)
MQFTYLRIASSIEAISVTARQRFFGKRPTFHPKVRNARIILERLVNPVSAILLGLTSFGQIQAPSDSERLQGAWQIVAMVDRAVEKMDDPKYRGSSVEIAKNRFFWKAADGTVLLDGTFDLRPAKKKGGFAEMPMTMAWSGMPAKEYPGFYALEKNHLRLSIKVKEQHPKAVPVLVPMAGTCERIERLP